MEESGLQEKLLGKLRKRAYCTPYKLNIKFGYDDVSDLGERLKFITTSYMSKTDIGKIHGMAVFTFVSSQSQINKI